MWTTKAFWEAAWELFSGPTSLSLMTGLTGRAATPPKTPLQRGRGLEVDGTAHFPPPAAPSHAQVEAALCSAEG